MPLKRHASLRGFCTLVITFLSYALPLLAGKAVEDSGEDALAADRLSCHRFIASQFRLLLHGLAYQLLLAFRRYLEGTPWHNLEIESLRRRVFKLGSRIRETTRRIWMHCSSAYPEEETFFPVLQRICSPPG